MDIYTLALLVIVSLACYLYITHETYKHLTPVSAPVRKRTFIAFAWPFILIGIVITLISLGFIAAIVIPCLGILIVVDYLIMKFTGKTFFFDGNEYNIR